MSENDEQGAYGDHRTLTLESPVGLGGQPVVRNGCLIYVSDAGPGDQGRTLLLEEGSVIIGRDAGCGLCLDDESVSREHVKLSIQKKGVLVEDLGSKNKTTYLGKEVDSLLLGIGSRIGIGSCVIDLLPLPVPGSMPISTLSRYGGLVGASIPMRRLYALIGAMEQTDAPVLLEGETGTGKELLAQAIYEHGLRQGKPFVVIDCGNVPAGLLESELYGCVRGAFTGANVDRAGALEAADSGTVFLDEIDELPLDLQPKLLRVLETGQVKRLGSVKPISLDIRIIASSKQNLLERVKAGSFRDDLYYRLAVLQLRLPPLMDRKEDIPLLVKHFGEVLPEGKNARIAPEMIESFVNHDWPGNVRELRNAVQRALVLGPAAPTVLSPEFSGSGEQAKGSSVSANEYRIAREQTLDSFDRTYLGNLMSRFDGNQSAAARAAGISRSYLRELLKKSGLL